MLASLDLMNDRSSNYVAVNAVQYAVAERCSTIAKAGQQIVPLSIQARRCIEHGMVRGNGSWAYALSQSRQVILLGIEHGLWRGFQGCRGMQKRCSDDGVMLNDRSQG